MTEKNKGGRPREGSRLLTTSMPSVRVDEQMAADLAALRAATGLRNPQIVRWALADFLLRIRQPAATPADPASAPGPAPGT